MRKSSIALVGAALALTVMGVAAALPWFALEGRAFGCDLRGRPTAAAALGLNQSISGRMDVQEKLTTALNHAEIDIRQMFSRISRLSDVETSSLSNEIRRGGIVMSTITVGNSSELSLALKSVKSGDTILLREGTYSDISIRNVVVDGEVTIKSLDPQNMATITDLQIYSSKGLTFRDLEISVTPESTATGAVGVISSTNIRLDHLNVHGSLNGNPQDDADGIRIKESTNVSVTNSEFQQLRIAIGHGDSNQLDLSGNYIHDIRMDGIRGGGSSNVMVKNNYFTNFYQIEGDHADAIQFYSGNINKSVHDIVVEGNVVVQGDGQEIQGIFLRNSAGSLFENVTIAKNMIVGGNWNGIMVEGSKNLQVLNNTVVSLANETSWIRILSSENATLVGNSALKYLLDPNSSISESNNAINGTVGDGGLAALKTWLTQNPLSLQSLPADSLAAFSDLLSELNGAPVAAPVEAPILESVSASTSQTLAPNVKDLTLTGDGDIDGVGNDLANVIIGNTGDNHLSGMAGNDVLEGGEGKDIIDGGDGIDTASYAHAKGGVAVSLIRWNGDSASTTFQSTGGAGDHKLISIENLQGSAFNDTLAGDNGGNVLVGGAGDDRLTGGIGADSLVGGGGADTFNYTSVEQSTVALSGRDVIFDFSAAEGDKISLRTIDAVDGTSTNENFKFVAQFTKVAGQLTSVYENDHYVVRGDTNGDGVADFAINVFSSKALVAADFIL